MINAIAKCCGNIKLKPTISNRNWFLNSFKCLVFFDTSFPKWLGQCILLPAMYLCFSDLTLLPTLAILSFLNLVILVNMSWYFILVLILFSWWVDSGGGNTQRRVKGEETLQRNQHKQEDADARNNMYGRCRGWQEMKEERTWGVWKALYGTLRGLNFS